MREQEECSAVGADGRSDDLSQLVRVSIGWQIGDTFIEQIGICHDEKVYGTIWTHYTLHGSSINFRSVACVITGNQNHLYVHSFHHVLEIKTLEDHLLGKATHTDKKIRSKKNLDTYFNFQN